MKGIVNTYLNERIQRPTVEADSMVYYEPGDEVEIVDIVDGDEYEGNHVWFELDNGAYIWSGGVSGNRNILPELRDEAIAPEIEDGGFDLRKAWPLISFDGFTDKGGAGIRVAIVDSGYNHHDDISPNRIQGLNLRKKNSDDSFSTDISDDVGHGTHMAGLIGANGKMIGCAPNCDLSILKIFNEKLREPEALKMLPSAINEAIRMKAHVVSLSLETSILSNDLRKAIDSAISQNIVIIGSIGTNSEDVNYPGFLTEVIGVGNCFINNQLELEPAEDSGRGNGISCVAPGINISSLSHLVPNQYKPLTGPSVSVALVSGIVACVLSEFTSLDRADISPGLIKTALEKTASKLGFSGYSQKFGHGLINPSDLLRFIRNELRKENGGSGMDAIS